MDGNGKETKQDNGLEIEQKNRQEKKTVPGKPEEIIPSGKQEGKPALKKREGKPALADAGSSGEKKEGRKKSGKGGGNDSKKKKSPRKKSGTVEASDKKSAFKPRVVSGGKETSKPEKISAGENPSGSAIASKQRRSAGTEKPSGGGQRADTKKSSGKEKRSGVQKSSGSEKRPDIKKASDEEKILGGEKNLDEGEGSRTKKPSGEENRSGGKKDSSGGGPNQKDNAEAKGAAGTGKEKKGKKGAKPEAKTGEGKKGKKKKTAGKKRPETEDGSGKKKIEKGEKGKTTKRKKAAKPSDSVKDVDSPDKDKINPSGRPKAVGKPGKPNLRLVKNDDLPVKEENAEKKKKGKKTGQKPKEEKKKAKDAYQDKLDLREWFVQNKSLVIIGFTVFAFFSILFAVYRYITTAYEVTTVYVDGNVHYTNEEVMDMVMGGRYGNNSLYLALKYKNKRIEGVPFVEKMDVHILSPNTIRISVYEKALAGYVEYLGRYMYFDRDGIVVESSEDRTSGIPQVTGLKFNYVVLNELLPVENDEIFKRILDITQLLNKYELMADKIFFDSSYDLTLFFGEVRVMLGSNSDIDQKIIRLKNILPELEGKKGTLQMENYTEDTKNITFQQE